MEIVILHDIKTMGHFYNKSHAQKMSINFKWCNLIGAATIGAARMSEGTYA